ncbi:MAG: CehA/McbA family metallohydrolase, partial [Bryobacteraceae bacterium]
DLNIAPVITRHVGTRREPPAYPSKHLVHVDARHIVSLQNQEVERLRTGYGAVVLLNAPEPVDWRTTDLFPLDADFCVSARRSGAFVDGEKPIWKNVPVNVALGVLDSIGIVNNHFHPRTVLLDAEKWGSMERDKAEYSTPRGFAQWMIDLYYSFLNCGFRLPVSAGSASGIMPSWPGYERVYVHLSREFSYEQWFRDLRAGRSIATNGPLLEVSVNGKPPGAAFDWIRGARYSLNFTARSQTRLEPVEVIFNGRVMRRFDEPRQSVELEVPEPGWLAVRCFEPAQDTVRYAHSSPFYFTRDGRLPVIRADAQRWAEYVARLSSTLDPTMFPSRENFDYVASKLRQAERVYRDLK